MEGIYILRCIIRNYIIRNIMNQKIKLGQVNRLKINRVSEPGLYLIAKDEEEVLLPNAYIKPTMQINDMIDVFIYTDSEDRLVATTETPLGFLHDYVCLEVVDLAKFGAFVDMGLPKDLLVPKNRQKSTFREGDRKVVQIVEDEKTHRLIGTEKFQLEKADKLLQKNDEVTILLYGKTPLGFKVIVNNSFEGMIYHNEIFTQVNVGDKKTAYIKYIRDDGKIDISLQKIGAKKSDENAQKVLDILKNNTEALAFTYKSDAEDIKNVFGLSKKAFKSSLTQLINNNAIQVEENGIKLNN